MTLLQARSARGARRFAPRRARFAHGFGRFASSWGLVFAVWCLSSAIVAHAQEPALWPGAKYDPAIPTIKQVLGHDHGEVITPPEGVAQYLQALQKAAPTRTRLMEYARTWEGRPLWLFVVGSADRIEIGRASCRERVAVVV